MSLLKRKMLNFPDPRETVVLKTGVFSISLDFRSSEERFAFQQGLLE